MKKAHRIGYHRYFTDKEFEKHIKFISRNIDVIDEVALFVEYSHFGYWELSGQRELAVILKKRLDAYRETGVRSVGLNVLDTVGHLEEAWDVFPKPPMQTMVSINGEVSTSCLCPNTKEFRDYTEERYAILAAANPDFIWVDDDLRIGNHGVAGPCYCSTCIAEFNAKTERGETFESLTRAVKAGDGEISGAWHKFCYDSYGEVAALIEKAVHSVDPGIILGEMTGSTEHWFGPLKAEKGRPGGGFYEDSNPYGILYKALACERQILSYPPHVTDIQYEFENFPYQELGKSKTVMSLEPYFAAMSGCGGVAFNTSGHDNYRLMEVLHEHKARYDTLTSLTEGKHACGVNVGTYDTEIMKVGIPSTFDPRHACVYIIDQHEAASGTDEQLRKMLSKGAFVRPAALPVLEKRGYLGLCGVKPGNRYHSGIQERFTGDILNGDDAGYIRNCYMNFFNRDRNSNFVTVLEPAEGARVVSEAVTVTDAAPMGACLTVYENAPGGRVAVTTYDYPNFYLYSAKRRQLTSIFDWLSRSALPVIIGHDCKVVPMFREDDKGNFVCLLANMNFDATGEFDVLLRTKADVCKILGSDGIPREAERRNTDGGTYVRISNIEPWQTVVISGETR
ncbi:MAG: hypothetical protein GX628_08005 [Clostridiales bacterium]|nr:hypothetical protein [Clostridiales bacterium]